MPKPFVLYVHEHMVQSYAMPGGAVYEEVVAVQRSTKKWSVVYAPKRSGRLSRAIGMSFPKPGPLRASGYVYYNIRYASSVMLGTEGMVIKPKAGRFLAVPKNRAISSSGSQTGYQGRELLRAGRVKDVVRRRSVKGQRKNSFAERALKTALAENGY